jgi:hypothetical protein
MSSDADIERLIEALQQDGPSERDAARLRARLAGIGIATSAGIAHGTAAASVPAAKAAASAGVGLSTRWAALSLLPKMGIVATVAATAVGGPLVVGELRERAVTAPASAPTRASPPARPLAEASHVEASLPARTALEVVPTVAPRVEAVRAVSAPARASRTNAAGEKAPVAVPDVASAAVVAASATTDVAAASDVATARFVENQPPPRASSLAEETALIDAAFAALRVQDATTAAALVAEHARRFPRGLLWRERERARQKLSAAQLAPGG